VAQTTTILSERKEKGGVMKIKHRVPERVPAPQLQISKAPENTTRKKKKGGVKKRAGRKEGGIHLGEEEEGRYVYYRLRQPGTLGKYP